MDGNPISSTKVRYSDHAEDKSLSEGNNALHLAAKHDASQVTQVLLSESSVDPKAPNSKGKCFLHLVAFHGEDNAVQQMSILQEYW